MPKKKQSTQTELFAYVKTAKYRFKTKFNLNMVNNKMAKIWNWYFIYQFHRRPFMSLNWYLVFKTTMTKKRKMATFMPWDDRQFKLGETCAMQLLFVLTRQNQKFLHDTRETSPLTALFFSQFVLSSNMENSSDRASLLLICIPLSIHAIGHRN